MDRTLGNCLMCLYSGRLEAWLLGCRSPECERKLDRNQEVDWICIEKRTKGRLGNISAVCISQKTSHTEGTLLLLLLRKLCIWYCWENMKDVIWKVESGSSYLRLICREFCCVSSQLLAASKRGMAHGITGSWAAHARHLSVSRSYISMAYKYDLLAQLRGLSNV